MAVIHVHNIGESVIAVGERRLTPDAPHLFALLLFLAEGQGRAIQRSELSELLFDVSGRARATSHNLRQLLYRLKRFGVPLELTDRTVRLATQHVARAIDTLVAGSYDDRKTHLRSSYGVLPHYAPPTQGRVAVWVESLRDTLHNRLRQQFCIDIITARQRADWQHLEALSRRALELDPLNESAVLGLAEATARSGSKALALSILDTYRQDLGEERADLALPAKLLGKRIDTLIESPTAKGHIRVRLVGRSEEMTLLVGAWERARQGRFVSVRLTGDKSIGKSRLAEEFGATVTMDGTGHVLTKLATPTDRDRPLSLIADLVSQILSLPGAAGCDPEMLPVLRRLSGSIAPCGSVRAEHAYSEYESAAIRNAFFDLLSSVCEERPILCIIDNADDLDEASQALLATFSDRAGDVRIMFLSCHSTADGATPHAAITAVRLHPLSAPLSKDLLKALGTASGRSMSEELAERCLDVAAGNPGHLELLVSDDREEWELSSVPADLLALADRRILSLTMQAQYALQAIVVLSDPTTPAHIAELTGLGTHELIVALHALEDASLIVQSVEGIRCRTMFLATRARLTASRIVICMMEGRAAALIEAENSQQRWTPAIAWRIASHWQNAGQPRRARSFLRASWQHAVSIGHPMSAAKAIRDELRLSLEPDERAALLDDLIGALQAAGDLPGVIAAVDERYAMGSRLQDSAHRRAELEFDRDEARVMNQSTPSSHVGSLSRHANSSVLDSRRRLRAARLLIMGADGALDERLAVAALTSSQSIDVGDVPSLLLRDQISLIYHTVFGDRDEALRIATRLESRVRRSERSWYTFISLRNCSLARQLVDRGPTDYESLERTYADALDAAMISNALWSATHLTSVLIDDGNIAEACRWMTISEGLASSHGESVLPIDYFSAQVDLALLDENYSRAERYLSQMQRNAPRYESARLRNDLLIYRIRVRQLSGGHLVSQSELQALLVFHELAKDFGRHDDHMDVLWAALSALGETAKASELLSLYLRHHRRERRPCRYFLRFRTGSDPAWSSRYITRVGEEPEQA